MEFLTFHIFSLPPRKKKTIAIKIPFLFKVAVLFICVLVEERVALGVSSMVVCSSCRLLQQSKGEN